LLLLAAAGRHQAAASFQPAGQPLNTPQLWRW
jgi:hypothetical protein